LRRALPERRPRERGKDAGAGPPAYGHNLKRLFEATPIDWSDIDFEHIEFYNDAVMSQALRYRRKDKPFYVMEPDHLLPFMEKVFHRCLQHISPGAKRGLRPR
jgi:hypothetical protein